MAMVVAFLAALQLVHYLEWQNVQESIELKWKRKWSKWNDELNRYADLLI